jgi:hypothetical protein
MLAMPRLDPPGALGGACTSGWSPHLLEDDSHLGRGSKGSYFRILVPDDWDGDIFLVNHGLVLDPLTIAPHDTCRGDPATACAVDADCAAIEPGVCNSGTAA